MKKIFRTVIFSLLSIYLTSLWNYGFSFDKSPVSLIKATLIIAAIFYLIIPLSKIVLLPLNILTIGLASTLFYFILFHFLNYVNVVSIKPWTFNGTNLLGLIIPKFYIQYYLNLFLSALSISTIINLLETVL